MDIFQVHAWQLHSQGSISGIYVSTYIYSKPGEYGTKIHSPYI